MITIVTATKATAPQGEPDRRYRVMVLLQRSDRPKYYTFHCPKCTQPVGDLVNAEIKAMSDLMDMNNVDNVGVGTRCDGYKCRVWYYFTLSD